MATVADVFIVESLRMNDEVEQRYEGRRLADILRMAGKKPKYFYFQEKRELPHILKIFKESKYRYLHFSCHAALNQVMTTYSAYTYPEFAQEMKGYLKERRVFFSACELGNELFTNCLAGTNKGMHSIAAPAEEIDFDHAAAIWSSFYVSVFSSGNNSMRHGDIVSRLKILGSLFPVDFHFSGYHAKQDTWRHAVIPKSSIKGVNGKVKGVAF
ncbi:hypothetical protein O999_20890 [Pseudomonas putida LF54]|uniref:hypothetical protein n=1 Tax=Pseudomonas putida TaxID=303 RepID=UPI0003AEB4F0|nr:hypothetical protein [Pseudomonas putida]ERL01836.1 hypothetical protein O999_20890 [Pseudomonas putida LF54]